MWTTAVWKRLQVISVWLVVLGHIKELFNIRRDHLTATRTAICVWGIIQFPISDFLFFM